MKTETEPIAHPVIGVLRPYVSRATGDLVEGGFEEFETPEMIGLARVRVERLDILSIGAKRPGRGDCTRFVVVAQRRYARIRFLHVMNPRLGAILERAGFKGGLLYEDGEIIRTLVWERECNAPSNDSTNAVTG